jgi:hypothetical protein
MPVTVLTVATITRAGLASALAAANADGSLLPNTGQEFLTIANASAEAVTVSAAITRQVDGQTPPARSISVPAGATRHFGPFPTVEYNNADRQVAIAFSAVTDVTVQALRLPKAG